jgi:hypothetical protein
MIITLRNLVIPSKSYWPSPGFSRSILYCLSTVTYLLFHVAVISIPYLTQTQGAAGPSAGGKASGSISGPPKSLLLPIKANQIRLWELNSYAPGCNVLYIKGSLIKEDFWKLELHWELLSLSVPSRGERKCLGQLRGWENSPHYRAWMMKYRVWWLRTCKYPNTLWGNCLSSPGFWFRINQWTFLVLRS